MDWLVTAPIAHRGLHDGVAPENSLAAFEAAVTAGIPIELDVQLSADGVVMVFHDDDLARLTTSPGRLSSVTAEHLATLRLCGSDSGIPTMAETLQLVAGRVPLLVEIKNAGAVGALESRLAALLDDYTGPFAVQSFNPGVVRWFRQNRPAWRRGQLASDFTADTTVGRARRFVLRHMLLNPITRPDFVAYDVRALPAAAVSRVRRRGTPVLAWTVRDAASLETARKHADNIIFEQIRPS